MATETITDNYKKHTEVNVLHVQFTQQFLLYSVQVQRQN